MDIKFSQRGITIWGLAYIVSTLGLIGFIGIRLFSPGYEFIRARATLESVLSRADDPATLTPAEVRKYFLRAASLNDLGHKFHKGNIKDYVTVMLPRKSGDIKTATLRYEIRSPVLYNFYILIDVDETVELVRTSARK